MTALLDVQNLNVGFRQDGVVTPAVRGVSFTVNRGEVVALVGESGSGKSVSALSTVSLLGDSAQVAGSVKYDGQELIGADERRLRQVRGNDISFIFQEPMSSLNPLHTIEKQLTESLALHQGIIGAQARGRVLELLEKVGIRDAETRLSSYAHQLSGGQRQRVMIAMALANKPDILIADEPTTALDVTIQAQILDLLKDLKDAEGMGLLFITHDLAIVRRIADRVFVMQQGEVVESGQRKNCSAIRNTLTRSNFPARNQAGNPNQLQKMRQLLLKRISSRFGSQSTVGCCAEQLVTSRRSMHPHCL